MKKLLLTLSLSGLFLTLISSSIFAQTQTKAEVKAEKKQERIDRSKVKQAKEGAENITRIETLNFSFYPTTVEPEFGIQREIDNLDYYVTVQKNNLSINLPYIGRFYIQPISPEDVPIQIYSSKFVYMVHTDNEVDFEVTIAPQDVVNILNEGILFKFTINKTSGNTTLTVSANNRQDVTYTGYFQ